MISKEFSINIGIIWKLQVFVVVVMVLLLQLLFEKVCQFCLYPESWILFYCCLRKSMWKITSKLVQLQHQKGINEYLLLKNDKSFCLRCGCTPKSWGRRDKGRARKVKKILSPSNCKCEYSISKMHYQWSSQY